MSCEVFDAFPQATEHLSESIHQLAYQRSLPLNIIPRARFPLEVGKTITSFIIGNQYPPSVEEAWHCMVGQNGCGEWSDSYGQRFTPTLSGSGDCSVCWNDCYFGYRQHAYAPERFALRGPVICIDEHLFSHSPAQFVNQYVRALAKRVQLSLENRHLNVYMHLVPKWSASADFQKCDPGGSLTSGCAPQTPDMGNCPPPTSRLTQEMLDAVALDLIENGAPDAADTNGWVTLGPAGPLFTLLIGAEASNNILLDNDHLRADFNFSYASKGEDNPVLRRIAAPVIIKNFRHVITIVPPRFNYYEGVGWVRIPPHILEAGTKGYRSVINPAWQAAAYEAAIVMLPQVMTERVFPPKSSVGDLKWEPQNYAGEWIWKTGGSEICTETGEEYPTYDPTKKLGRHFCEYMHAYEPVFPEHGALILFKRCPTATFETITCTS